MYSQATHMQIFSNPRNLGLFKMMMVVKMSIISMKVAIFHVDSEEKSALAISCSPA